MDSNIPVENPIEAVPPSEPIIPETLEQELDRFGSDFPKIAEMLRKAKVYFPDVSK